jgi:ureidoglycolate dehydrogenase (NAD+)
MPRFVANSLTLFASSAPLDCQDRPTADNSEGMKRRNRAIDLSPTRPRGPKKESRTRLVSLETNVPAAALNQWAIACLTALQLPPRDAREIAASLVQTSLWGIDSHGIARLGHYFSRIAAGSIASRPTIRVKRTGPCTAQVDGGHGHGIVVCRRAMDEAIALAKKNGIGAVGVSNSSHCGATALYGRQAARAGLIGIAFTHSDAFVAPHGGRKKFLGTNPICITVPTGDPEHPLCLDMATSAVPFNRIANYRRENRPLQAGWALDQRGRPTLNPHAVACLLPLAGHKGYALAFMIDLLCGPLNGMPFGPHIPEMYRKLSQRRKLGSFFIAIEPKRFGGGKKLPGVARRMAQEARAQPRARAKVKVLAPGDPEHHSAERRAQTGIPVEPGLRQEIDRWSKRLGVLPP